MRKIFILIVGLLLSVAFNQLYAQLPEVSTSANPKWYYIKVQGSDSGRKDRLFTNETYQIFGREKVASLSFADMNKQLWRFEKDENDDYVLINKSVTHRKLDIAYDEDLKAVRAVLSVRPTTSWKITPKGKYYGIQATTPVTGRTTYKFAHQANNSSNRDYSIIMETSTWENNADSYFSFVEFEDPNLEMSNDESQTWYVIKSNRPGYENKCVTDIVSSALPNIKFGIDDVKEGDYSQQWKAVKKSATASDTRFDLVNRATGNIIQTTYSLEDGYYYTQSTQNMEESNGWQIDYIAEKQYTIYGTNEDGLKRYLNATLADEIPEMFIEGGAVGTGFSWTFEKVGGTTGIDYIAQPDDWDNIIIYSQDRRICVEGAEDYVVRTLTGIVVNKNASLPTGVYLVTVNGKTKAVVNQ